MFDADSLAQAFDILSTNNELTELHLENISLNERALSSLGRFLQDPRR